MEIFFRLDRILFKTLGTCIIKSNIFIYGSRNLE